MMCLYILKLHPFHSAQFISSTHTYTNTQLKSIHIDTNTLHSGPNKRCFFVKREDGTTDDVSMVKAVNGITAATKE
jgi:hypothetical protein